MRRTLLLLILFSLTVNPCPVFIRANIQVSSARRYPFIEAGKLGFHDNQGNIVIPAQFDAPVRLLPGFFDGAARVTVDGRPVFIDENGTILFHPDLAFETLDEVFSDGLLRFRRDGLYGYLDKQGRIAIEPRFPYAGEFSEGLAPFNLDPTDTTPYGYIDKTGNIAIPPQFALASGFHEGLARVGVEPHCGFRHPCRFGFIDRTGTLVIPTAFDNALDIHEDLAAVKKDWLWGYIDKNGHTAIPFRYDQASSFSDGLAYVVHCDDRDQIDPAGERGYIKKSGQIVGPLLPSQ